MNEHAPSGPGGTPGLKQLLGAVVVTAASVGMLLGSFVLSQLEAPKQAPPTPRSVAQESTVTPFLPSSTPHPSPTAAATLAEPTPTPIPPTPEPTSSPTPVPTATPTPAPTATSAPTASPSPPASCASPAGWISYTVRTGDTLASLARRGGVTTAALMQANCLSTATLRAGDSINVPPSLAVRPTAVPTVCGPPLDWVRYTVQPDDTLHALARRFNLQAEVIRRANCLPSDVIRAGQTLYVPTRAAAPSPTHYPAPVLLSPAHGARFPAGREVAVRWAWDGELGEDQHFDVRLWQEGAPHYGVGWSKDKAYGVLGEPGVTYFWSVAVIYGKDGQMLQQLSPESPPRKLLWGTSE